MSGAKYYGQQKVTSFPDMQVIDQAKINHLVTFSDSDDFTDSSSWILSYKKVEMPMKVYSRSR
jgi:hypothetical protein